LIDNIMFQLSCLHLCMYMLCAYIYYWRYNYWNLAPESPNGLDSATFPRKECQSKTNSPGLASGLVDHYLKPLYQDQPCRAMLVLRSSLSLKG
jgi:hypothetical protein